MARYIIDLMEKIPYGFPVGWVAARVSEGNYKLATVDAVWCVVLIAGLHVWRRYSPS